MAAMIVINALFDAGGSLPKPQADGGGEGNATFTA